MGSSRPAPGGNTRISRRVVFAVAASAAIGGGNSMALWAGDSGCRCAAPHEEITQKISWLQGRAGRCNPT
jgi:hypothetical protein